MCQAYEAEAAFVRWREERDAEAGRPYGCDFQAGYFQCPERNNYYALSERYKVVSTSGDKLWGWECRTCGTFYPNNKGIVKGTR